VEPLWTTSKVFTHGSIFQTMKLIIGIVSDVTIMFYAGFDAKGAHLSADEDEVSITYWVSFQHLLSIFFISGYILFDWEF
jgi:hypothetical protein